MKIKKYECVVDNGKDVFKVLMPATSKKDVKKQLEDIGEVLKINERPEILPSADFIRTTLKQNGYGEMECAFVYRLFLNYVEGTED